MIHPKNMLTALIRRSNFHRSAFSHREASTAPFSVTTAQKLQESAMEEKCIAVDSNDQCLGEVPKRECHAVKDGQVALHRAFSVFLFNSQGDMLVQQRSAHKITYPSHYTNACCSHPLHEIPEEREELNALGIRRAAQRRLNYELGIPTRQIRPENMRFLTRIHYHDLGDGVWGEHEIDYILFLQKDVDLNPNPNEISDIRFIGFRDFESQIQSLPGPLTPWFKLILKHKLPLWWKDLAKLKRHENLTEILKF